MEKLLVMKKLLSCRVDETLMTKLLIRAAEDTIATKSKVGVGEVIERLLDAKLTGNTVDKNTGKDDDRVKRLQEELENADKNVRELMNQKQALFDEVKKLRVTRAEDDPSLVKQAVEVATKNCREENERLKKKIAELEDKVNQTNAEKLKEELGVKGKLVSGSQISAPITAARNPQVGSLARDGKENFL